MVFIYLPTSEFETIQSSKPLKRKFVLIIPIIKVRLVKLKHTDQNKIGIDCTKYYTYDIQKKYL